MVEASDWLVAICLFLMFGIVLILLAKRLELLRPTMTAYVLHCALGVILISTLGLVGPDAITYHTAALVQSQIWSGIRPTAVAQESFNLATAPGKQMFTWLLGSLYLPFGGNALIGVLLNAFFMSLTVFVLATATSRFDFQGSRKIAAWIAVLIPPFLYWTPYVTREALSILLLSLTVLAASMLYQNRVGIGIVLYYLLFVAVFFTRGQLTLVVLSSFILSSIVFSHYVNREARVRSLSQSGFLFLGVAGMIALSWFGLGNYWSLTQESIPANVASNSSPIGGLAIPSVSSEILSDASPSGNSDFPISIQDVVSTLVGPTPWEWSTTKLVIAGLDGMGYFLTWIIIIVAFAALRTYRWRISVLMLSISPLIAGTALTLANYGIIMRVRVHFIPFFIPVLALAIAQGYPHAKRLYLKRKRSLFSKQPYKEIGEG